MSLMVSASKLKTFQTCPYQYYLSYLERVIVPRGVRLVFGRAVHRTIQLFYRSNEKSRKSRLLAEDGATQLFPKSEESAQGIWFLVWGEALKEEKANPKIFPGGCQIRFDGKTAEEIEGEKNKYWRLGASMVKKYWRENAEAPFPEKVEMRFKIPFPTPNSGVQIVGVMDQIRRTKSGFWIIDLKTSWRDYGENDFRFQYPVHHDPQFTIYSWAFRQLFGEEEAGIIRYPLGYRKIDPKTGEKIDKRAVITYRGEEDYRDLQDLIDCFVNSLRKNLFSRAYGPACMFCDYLDVCAHRPAFSTEPIKVGEIDWGNIEKEKILAELSPRAKELDFHELRLKF